MNRHPSTLALLTLSATVACAGTARADAPGSPKHAPLQSVKASPYTVDLLAPGGARLPTYERGGRFYVLGQKGQRYTIRVTNPTPRRVEAVISVDGLDVIDGESADYRENRGYIVPARGELRVDGFRVSTRQVAAFRFSSVPESYAGRKGVDRNVGVIGVALFEEERRRRPVLIQPEPRPHPHARGGDGASRRYRDQEDSRGSGASPSADAPAAGESAGGAGPRASRSRSPSVRGKAAGGPCCGHRRERSGLGTRFGERRHSSVTWTRFERAHPDRPTAVAELRYNDRGGLAALGIPVRPRPDRHEIWTRETANPFPGRFSRPPRP